MKESGLRSFLKAFDKYSMEFIDVFAAGLITFGNATENHIELFQTLLKYACTDTIHYMQVLSDISTVLISTSRGRKALIDSGALS